EELERLTMRPQPSLVMYAWAALLIKNAPLRWTFMTVSQSSTDILNSRLSRRTPALLTRMAGGPRRSATVSTAAVTWSGSDTSQPTASAVPPSAVILSTTCWASASFRSSTATARPSRAKRSAVAAPMPWAAPVTIATRGFADMGLPPYFTGGRKRDPNHIPTGRYGAGCQKWDAWEEKNFFCCATWELVVFSPAVCRFP